MTAEARPFYKIEMFTLQKLLVLIAVIGAVWYGFKFVSRLRDARRTDDKLRDSAARRSAATEQSARDPARKDAEDMVRCPVCQAYVQARGVAACDRAACPY